MDKVSHTQEGSQLRQSNSTGRRPRSQNQEQATSQTIEGISESNETQGTKTTWHRNKESRAACVGWANQRQVIEREFRRKTRTGAG